ncbi:hypothetical protein K438DRAFT_570435 [Mycena galopus ATCC 62051]|nr:hypothetical protein K438DRAFT_570435 [Mycena galopus ATCC 62051]
MPLPLSTLHRHPYRCLFLRSLCKTFVIAAAVKCQDPQGGFGLHEQDSHGRSSGKQCFNNSQRHIQYSVSFPLTLIRGLNFSYLWSTRMQFSAHAKTTREDRIHISVLVLMQRLSGISSQRLI